MQGVLGNRIGGEEGCKEFPARGVGWERAVTWVSKYSNVRGMSRTDLTPAQIVATGVRPSSVRSADTSMEISAPLCTPPIPVPPPSIPRQPLQEPGEDVIKIQRVESGVLIALWAGLCLPYPGAREVLPGATQVYGVHLMLVPSSVWHSLLQLATLEALRRYSPSATIHIHVGSILIQSLASPTLRSTTTHRHQQMKHSVAVLRA